MILEKLRNACMNCEIGTAITSWMCRQLLLILILLLLKLILSPHKRTILKYHRGDTVVEEASATEWFRILITAIAANLSRSNCSSDFDEYSSDDSDRTWTEKEGTRYSSKSLDPTKRLLWSLKENEKLSRWRKAEKNWTWIFSQFPNRTLEAVCTRWYSKGVSKGGLEETLKWSSLLRSTFNVMWIVALAHLGRRPNSCLGVFVTTQTPKINRSLWADDNLILSLLCMCRRSVRPGVRWWWRTYYM